MNIIFKIQQEQLKIKSGFGFNFISHFIYFWFSFGEWGLESGPTDLKKMFWTTAVDCHYSDLSHILKWKFKL